MDPKQQPAAPDPDGPLVAALAPLGGRVGIVLAYVALHAMLVMLGYLLKTSIAEPAVIWPSAGLTIAALWLAPLPLWPVLLAVTAVWEVAVAGLLIDPFRPGVAALYTATNLFGAVTGAALARWLIPDISRPHGRLVLRFVFASAAGALAGAVTGAAVNHVWHGSGAAGYLALLQLWWAGNWLGCLVVTPVIASWVSPARRHPALALGSRLELALFAVVLVASGLYVFSADPQHTGSLLRLPTTIVALMIFAAMRLPPRWVSILFAVTSIACAWLVAQRLGPFRAENLFFSFGQAQAFLASLGAVSLALSMSTAEKNMAIADLRNAEVRYRSFVKLSTEAVWRVELAEPMPVSLPAGEQVAWLRSHAGIVEYSRSFERLDRRTGNGARRLPWCREVAWCAAYEDNMEQAMMQDYSIDGLRFPVDDDGARLAFVSSFSGVVEGGRLRRIWGVARDITELTELNARLLREQDRLKTYARRLMTAEEKARRATAVDLHDGIGQSLAGMAMTLDVARQHAPADVAQLIGEVESSLRDVQERTRHMIHDLSPPGLYDLGLVPALHWLAVYMRGRDRLHVEMDAEVIEEWIKLDMRVLVFKLVRELLRNVAKHAGVDAARVRVHGDAARLLIEVSDRGRGFDWVGDAFGAKAAGFGLWSIGDRVKEAGGRFSVDTAPGRGARFELRFPLGGARLARAFGEPTVDERS